MRHTSFQSLSTWVLLLFGCWLAFTPAPVAAQGQGGGSGFGGSSGTGGGFSGGGGGGFSGGSGLSTGGGAGAGGGAARGGTTGTTTGIPSVANPFRTFYRNPVSVGLVAVPTSTFSSSSGSSGGGGGFSGSSGGGSGGSSSGNISGFGNNLLSQGTFGQPLFGTTTSGGTGATGLGSNLGGTGTGSLAGSTGSTTTGAVSFSTTGTPRYSNYITEQGDTLPYVPLTPLPQLAGELRGVLGRSSAIARSERIQLNVDGQRVILRGSVGSAREKRLAESLIRLTPGVRDVLNELTIE